MRIKRKIPFFTIFSKDFEKDQMILKDILNECEIKTNSNNAFKFTNKPKISAGWWFYEIYFASEFIQRLFQLILPIGFSHNMEAVAKRMTEAFQQQLRKNGSDAGIKMYADIPLASKW